MKTRILITVLLVAFVATSAYADGRDCTGNDRI